MRARVENFQLLKQEFMEFIEYRGLERHNLHPPLVDTCTNLRKTTYMGEQDSLNGWANKVQYSLPMKKRVNIFQGFICWGGGGGGGDGESPT